MAPPKKGVAEQLAELQKQLKQREDQLTRQLEKTQAELDELQRTTIARYLDLARKHPADPGVFPALEYLVTEETPHAEFALELIAKHHVNAPRLGRLCLFLSEGDEAARPQTEKLLRAAVARSTHPEVKGLCRLALARVLYIRGEAEATAEADRARALREAEGLLAEVAQKYARVKLPGEEDGRLAGDEAAPMLFELRYLANGRPAPALDGKDLDGKAMKLADYRGKVVLLEFWSSDCEACLSSLPGLRRLSGRYAGRPFAVVGINGDEPDNLAVFRKKESLPWRSFPNRRPGRKDLSEEWNLKAWPTMYLIDPAGVIRRRWIGVPDEAALAAEVDKLVRQAEAAKKG